MFAISESKQYTKRNVQYFTMGVKAVLSLTPDRVLWREIAGNHLQLSVMTM